MSIDYFKLPGISASFLKECHKSDFDGWNYLHNPRPATDAMNFGTAVHAVLLEFERFNDLIAVSPKFDRRTKVGKEAAQAFEETAQGKVVIDEEEHARVKLIRERCLSIPIIADALSKFDKEKVFTWEMDGLDCKAKLDLVDSGSGVVIDVKTTRNAEISQFIRQTLDLRYDIQLAHYASAISKDATTYAIAIESDTAQVACYDLTDIIRSPFTESRYRQAVEAAVRVRSLKEEPLKFSTEIVRATLPRYLEAV